MKKDAYYFPHDANARNDPKLTFLKLLYGVKGIGMFWILVEILREQQDFKLPLDNGITWGSLAYEFSSTPEESEAFVNDCIHKFKLLKTDGNLIWSDSLIDRMSRMIEAREQKSAAGKKGMETRWGNKSGSNNGVITPLYQKAENEQSVITENNKGEESIGEYSRGEKKRENKEDIYDAVIGYLNKKAGTAYRTSSQKTKDLIRARQNEEFTLQDFYTVIDKKANEWTNTDMQKFLRPETLFSNKFEGYLNQKNNSQKLKKQSQVILE